MSEGVKQKKPIDFGMAIGMALTALAVITFAWAFPEELRSYCSNMQIADKPTPYVLTIKGEAKVEDRKYSQQQAGSASAKPLAAEIEASGRVYPAEQPRNEPNAWWQRFWCNVNASDYFVALFTLVLAAVTGFLWFSTHRLWKAGEKQIIAAQTAADAAVKSANTAESAQTTLERPYVFIGDIFQISMAPDKPRTITFKATNYGRTPAVIQIVKAELIFSKSIPNVPYEFSNELEFENFYVLGTGEPTDEYDYEIPTNISLVSNSIDGVVLDEPAPPEGELAYFLVEILYDDAQGRPHSKGFCWQYDAGRHFFVRHTDRACHYQT
jgi:hypothetical protein